MRETDLTRRQAQVLCDRIAEMLLYLSRLRARIDERGFPPDDRLRREVEAAHDAMHRLRMTLHYRSCGPANERSREQEGRH